MKRNETPPQGTGKVGAVLSLLFHVTLIAALAFLAAREGMLGNKFKEIAVVIVPKQKPPEKPKEEKKPTPPKVEEAKKQEPEKKPDATPEPPRQETAKAAPDLAPPVMVDSAPPPAAIQSDFTFSDGAKTVTTSADPVTVYNSLLEYSFHSIWSYPRNMQDPSLATEVEVAVDTKGNVEVKNWKQLSGNTDWDASVKKVFQQVRTIRRPPPAGFPKSVVIRFDMLPREITASR